jgi:multiple sugar transport system permease protein
MRRARGGALILYGALGLSALLTLAPLLWMVSASLMRAGEASVLPPPILPSDPTLDHYRALFTRLDLARHFANSVAITFSATVLSVLVCAMAGYALAKLRFGARDRLFRAMLAALVIPSQVGMLPLFLQLKFMGLVNTYAGAIIPYLASIYGIFMIRQYVSTVPDELLDAARVDGAGEIELFWTIVMPAIRPILVALAAYTFLAAWNDFMWPLIILSDEGKYTLPVALASLVGEHVQDTELMMAGAVVTVLPVIVVFLALQRVYVEGIMSGSVKG